MNSPAFPAASPPLSGWHRTRRVLGRWYRDPARRREWIISTFSAVWFTALLAYWAQGALLYRIDFPGVYTFGGFFLFPSADYLIPSLAAELSFGNIYFAQYLSLFVDVFLCTLGAQLLVREMFRNTFTPLQLTGVQALAATFYLVNPYNITWGYYALTLDLFLHNAAFFLVMALLVRLVRLLVARQKLRWSDAVWLGIGIGLSAPTSFPNLARTLLFEGIALFLVALLAFALFVSSRSDRIVAWVASKRFLLATLPIAAVLLAYPVWLFLTHWLLHPSSITVVAARGALVPPNSYNTLPNVIRLLGRRDFDLFPYYSLYLHNPAVIVGTWLWPVLAIAVPLLVTWWFVPTFADRKWVWVSEIIILPCIVWGTGLDPPFGSFNAWVIHRLPFGRQFMPAFFPVQLIMVKLYTVLVAFSVGVLFLAVRRYWGARRTPNPLPPPTADAGARRWRASRRLGQRPEVFMASVGAIAVVGLLLLAGAPIFDGGILYTEDGSKGGFFVPQAYFETRSALQSESGNALLLPAVGLYVHTTWGYVGVTGFYSEFYYPSQILEPAYFGPYNYLLNATKVSYAAATRAIAPGTNSTSIKDSTAGPWEQYNSTKPFYASNVHPALNLTGYEWLEVTIPTKHAALFLSYVAAQEVQVGLRTNKVTLGTYIIGRGGETDVLSSNSSTVVLGLLVPGPTKGHFDPSYVNALTLRFPSTLYFPALGLGTPTFVGVADSSLVPGWLSLVRSTYDLGYLLVDLTIHEGRTEPTIYGSIVAATLATDHLATPIVMTSDLQLWQLTGSGKGG